MKCTVVFKDRFRAILNAEGCRPNVFIRLLKSSLVFTLWSNTISPVLVPYDSWCQRNSIRRELCFNGSLILWYDTMLKRNCTVQVLKISRYTNSSVQQAPRRTTYFNISIFCSMLHHLVAFVWFAKHWSFPIIIYANVTYTGVKSSQLDWIEQQFKPDFFACRLQITVEKGGTQQTIVRRFSDTEKRANIPIYISKTVCVFILTSKVRELWQKSIFWQETGMKYSTVENSSFMCLLPRSHPQNQRSGVRETKMGGRSPPFFIVIY